MIVQTRKPEAWIIVSDGSTDGTDAIVERYLSSHDWIKLVRMPERAERHFAGKVHAFNAGYRVLKDTKAEIVGNLDADISFDEGYFEFLVGQFEKDASLGVGGTPFREENVQYNYNFSRREHVSGACQLFRRKCFEEIGGYQPLRDGAIDLCAVVSARMKGWKTLTFTEMHCIHHRKMGTAKSGIIAATFKSGAGDYRMGVHALWQVLRSIYQMTRKPLLLPGFALLIGYFWAALRHFEKPVSQEFVDFRKKEQILWLKGYVKKMAGRLLPPGANRDAPSAVG
jgi:poly-beta-1,6-N-acetyl-D-glucosamine synthase